MKQIDPNDLFGESYGTDWEYLPNSQEVRVSESGLKNAHTRLGEYSPFRKFVEYALHCSICCGKGVSARTMSVLWERAEDYDFKVVNVGGRDKVFCGDCIVLSED